jgi:hypothetical protein
VKKGFVDLIFRFFFIKKKEIAEGKKRIFLFINKSYSKWIFLKNYSIVSFINSLITTLAQVQPNIAGI